MTQETSLTINETAGRMMMVSDNIFFNVQLFEHSQRVARMLGASTMVPAHYRGPENIGNVLIALNYAQRIKADPFMVMQSLYVVHGRPGLEGKLVIALVNQCGRFDPLEFEEDKDGCAAFAKEIKSGRVLKGPKITWAMVKAEGWLDKPGSKWKSMSEIMFRYRSAAFFARTYCPEVMLGMQTKEEIEDFIDLQPASRASVPQATPEAWEPAPPFNFETYRQGLIDRGIASGEQIGRFIGALATHYKKSPEEVQAQIGADTDGFELSLTKWVAKGGNGTAPKTQNGEQAAKTETSPADDTAKTENVDPGGAQAAQQPDEAPKDDPRRAEFINLRSSGFSTWVWKNLDRVYSDEFADLLQEIQDKWAKIYPEEAFPTSSPAPTNGNGREYVHCMRKEQRVPVELCEKKCTYTNKCQAYLNYRKDKNQTQHPNGGTPEKQTIYCPEEDLEIQRAQCEKCESKAAGKCPAWNDEGKI